MGLFAIIILAIALSVDAFSVSLSIGLCGGKIPAFYKFRYFTVIGIFHILMMMIGWLLGVSIMGYISDYDHWVSFILLSYLGGKMIYEAFFSKDVGCDDNYNKYMNFRNTLVFGFALSIDAIVAGLTLGVEKVNIFSAASDFINMLTASFIVGTVAFLGTWFGIIVGRRVGGHFGKYSGIIGGVVLIALGLKTLLSHMVD